MKDDGETASTHWGGFRVPTHLELEVVAGRRHWGSREGLLVITEQGDRLRDETDKSERG